MAIDAASIPKDAKIAVLEKSSAESEKKIAGKIIIIISFGTISPEGTVRYLPYFRKLDPGPNFHLLVGL